MSTRRIPEVTIAAIIDDYRRGVPTVTIAACHGVSDKTIHRHTLAAGLREPNQSRPPRNCERCAKRCRQDESMCRSCQNVFVSIELTGGTWVPRGGIVHWQPDPKEVADGRAKCGTDGGYYSHLRHTKTEPCDACRAAHAMVARGGAPIDEGRRCDHCAGPIPLSKRQDAETCSRRCKRARWAARAESSEGVAA